MEEPRNTRVPGEESPAAAASGEAENGVSPAPEDGEAGEGRVLADVRFTAGARELADGYALIQRLNGSSTRRSLQVGVLIFLGLDFFYQSRTSEKPVLMIVMAAVMLLGAGFVALYSKRSVASLARDWAGDGEGAEFRAVITEEGVTLSTASDKSSLPFGSRVTMVEAGRVMGFSDRGGRLLYLPAAALDENQRDAVRRQAVDKGAAYKTGPAQSRMG